jgi:hypothetical protein
LDWLEHGVRLRWNKHGPPLPFDHGSCRLELSERAWAETEIARCLKTGAWEPATCADFVSRAFLVPKAGGSYRVVVDLRHVNLHCLQLTCRYETLKMLRTIARRQDHFFSFDLADGYHHIAIAHHHRRFFTFRLAGRLLQCAALPFGWNASPFVFTKVMRALVGYLRAPAVAAGLSSPSAARRQCDRPRSRSTPFERRLAGLRCLPYLDDFLFMVEGHHEALAARAFVDATLSRLGLRRNPKKGQWEPSQTIDHLGIRVDSRCGQFMLTPTRLRKLSTSAHDLLCRGSRDRGWVPAKRLASFLGLAQSASLAVAPARFFSRALYDQLATAPTWASKVHIASKSQAWADLHWWTDLPQTTKWHGRAIWQEPVAAVLYTDASDFGWGGLITSPLEVPARGFWSPEECTEHITWKELRAVRYSILSLLDYLQNKRVHLYTDNTAVWRIVQVAVSRSPRLMPELRELWRTLDENNIYLDTSYVRSADNPADSLSRERDPSACQLRPSIFARLDRQWGPHSIDRFASATDALLPAYNSRVLDPTSSGCNALAQNWGRGEYRNWAHPPWRDIPAVVFLLRETGAAATVIAPWWPAAPWFPDLMAITADFERLDPACSLLYNGRPWSAPHGLPRTHIAASRAAAFLGPASGRRPRGPRAPAGPAGRGGTSTP